MGSRVDVARGLRRFTSDVTVPGPRDRVSSRVEEILRNGDVDARDDRGRTLVHLCVLGRCYLPNKGDLDVDVQDDAGDTPLHLAVDHNNAWGVETLLSMGANTAITNNAGQRPIDMIWTRKECKSDVGMHARAQRGLIRDVLGQETPTKSAMKK